LTIIPIRIAGFEFQVCSILNIAYREQRNVQQYPFNAADSLTLLDTNNTNKKAAGPYGKKESREEVEPRVWNHGTPQVAG
jgi:hypothetical protein